MADLVLDEQRVPPVFDQVGDIGAAQRVEVQPGRQAERVAGLAEPLVQRADPDPLPALGRPQRRRGCRFGELRAGLVDPLFQHAGQPWPDGQHAAPLGR